MFFKKKPYIKFIPQVEGLKKYVPIVPAKDSPPKWWKDTKINKDVIFINNRPASVGTIKRCPGVSDFLNAGWIVPLWGDLTISIQGDDNLEYQFSDNRFQIEVHPKSQFLDLIANHNGNRYLHVLKLQTPWFIQTSKNYSIIQLNPSYHFNEYFDVSEGIQDTDIYHNLSIFLLLKKSGDYIIERGTPVCSIFPFKRETISSSVEDFNESKVKKLISETSFLSFSKHSPMLAYRIEQNKKNKCPFS